MVVLPDMMKERTAFELIGFVFLTIFPCHRLFYTLSVSNNWKENPFSITNFLCVSRLYDNYSQICVTFHVFENFFFNFNCIGRYIRCVKEIRDSLSFDC